MKSIIKKIFTFFKKKDTIKETNGSSFYINVVCKGKKQLDAELFDKNSDSYLFREDLKWVYFFT